MESSCNIDGEPVSNLFIYLSLSFIRKLRVLTDSPKNSVAQSDLYINKLIKVALFALEIPK